MSRTTMTAAFAVMLAASMPIAYAADTPSTTTNPPHATTTTTPPASGSSTASTASTHTSVPQNHIMPGQIRVTDMDGATVHDPEGKNIGPVKDVILDKDGKVAAVILDVGSFLGMGGKHVAVAMNDLKIEFDNNNKPKFSVNMTKDQLKSAQAFDLSEKTATTGTSTAPASRTDRTPPAENK